MRQPYFGWHARFARQLGANFPSYSQPWQYELIDAFMIQVGENEITGRLHFERIDQCADRVIVAFSTGYGIVSKAF
jgi:hypothetical protein